MTNEITIDLYLVGEDEDDAQAGMPFDSEHSARDYALDQPGPVNIYEVQATIDFTTMTRMERVPPEGPADVKKLREEYEEAKTEPAARAGALGLQIYRKARKIYEGSDDKDVASTARALMKEIEEEMFE